MTRGLVVVGGLGTGAFQAGALSALAEAGASWDVLAGSGAGALNAVLVADHRTAEMVRLWREQAAAGVPVVADLQDRAAAAAREAVPGARAALDPRAATGLVSTEMVAELVEPWSAGLSDRLRSRGRRLLLPVLDLAEGRARLLEPAAELPPDLLPAAVAAAAATPVACSPVLLPLPGARRPRPCVDGFGAMARPLQVMADAVAAGGTGLARLDLVLAVPSYEPGSGVCRLGLDEAAAAVDAARVAAVVEAELGALRAAGIEVRSIRPDGDSWSRFTGRPDADLRLEFPGALTRNGALLELTFDYGRHLAASWVD